MKRRSVQPDEELDPERGLYRALLALRSVDEMRAFFRDLCTPAELEALADRWAVVPFLERGMPYREIHDHTGVSVTTIGRVARYLAQGNGGYRLAADRTVAAKRSRPTGDSAVVAKRARPAADRLVVAKRSRPAADRLVVAKRSRPATDRLVVATRSGAAAQRKIVEKRMRRAGARS